MEKVLEGSPIGILSKETITRVANACISNHTKFVTGTSFAAGLPGGWWAAGTIPADLAQYYWHTFVLAQKLAYLYGLRDLRNENGELDELAKDTLTIFLGVMMGASAANKVIKNVVSNLAQQAVKRIPRQALTKTAWYPILKTIGPWIGIKITKGTVAKQAGKVIPLLGGVISGAITYASFRPCAKRLQKKLAEQTDFLLEQESPSIEEDA